MVNEGGYITPPNYPPYTRDGGTVVYFANPIFYFYAK